MTRSVLMFCPQFRPIVGGAERQAEKLSKALVQKGVRVAVLTPQFVAGTPAYEEDAGVAIHRFPLFDLCKRFPRVRGLGPLNLLLIRAQVIRAMNRHLQGVDVVHTHIASPMTAFAMQAAKRRQVPTLCKVAMAGVKSDLSELTAIGSGGRWLGSVMIKRLDRWVATTQAVADTLLEWHVPPERITCIPNGVDLPVLNRHSPKSGAARRFLYLGRLSVTAQRDVGALIRAFDRLAAQSPEVELALVGDGDLYQGTADLVSKCRHRDRIQLPGLQDPERWLRWADCFVLPSRREGLSNALLEAMAQGLPCIANDIPPNREVLADGAAGVLVPVGDEAQLFEAIRRMANDAAHVHAMRIAAFGRVRAQYGIEFVASRYVALYEEIIRNTAQ
ncbi:MAG: hypothetical protein DCF27_12115 [Lysobacteraceae bacterium]|nr:MAG: hypothetical protein DCF27_12115 [Xanthomonadaceae bacterium]